MMMGVSASASNPISTLNRVTSNALAEQKIVSGQSEDDAFGYKHEQQYPFVIRKQPFAQWRNQLQVADFRLLNSRIHLALSVRSLKFETLNRSKRPSAASETSAASMIAP